MSFLLDPSSPSSASASTSTSAPDSLAFPPGIAETNLTTVDDGSKSHILVPPTPSDAGPSAFAPSRRDTAAAPHVDVDEDRDEDIYEDTTAATDADAWPHRMQAPSSRAQSDVTSPTSTIQIATTGAQRGPARFALPDPQTAAERSPTASSSGQSSDSSVQHSSSRSPYSESESSGSSVESSSSSRDDSASFSSSTERSRWTATDLGVRSARATGKLRAGTATASGSSSGKGPSDGTRQSALSPTPHIRMSESLLFSHPLPPQAKWKGKEREWDPESEKAKEKARMKAPQRHHRRRSSASTTLTKIRTTRGDTVIKYQEPGISRDFFLFVTLCIGLACGVILIVRPATLSLLGHAGSVNFILDDLD